MKTTPFKIAFQFLICLTLSTGIASLSFAQSVGSNGGGCAKVKEANTDDAPKFDPNKRLVNVMTMGMKIHQFMESNHYRVAIVGRDGADLSKREFRSPSQQKYSHVGIIVPDGKGSWKFVHLLNSCAGPNSDIYEQGLAKFFTDDPFMYDFIITVPSEELQAKMETIINDKSVGEKGWAKELHYPMYSNIAYPFSLKYQNSNMWVLSIIAAAQSGTKDRAESQNYYANHGFQSSQVHLKSIESLGAAFGVGMPSNVHVDAHPRMERIRGWLSFVSADGVLNYLRETDKPLVDAKEICPDAGCNLRASELDQ
jgi:hypothetical protein